MLRKRVMLKTRTTFGYAQTLKASLRQPKSCCPPAAYPHILHPSYKESPLKAYPQICLHNALLLLTLIFSFLPGGFHAFAPFMGTRIVRRKAALSG